MKISPRSRHVALAAALLSTTAAPALAQTTAAAPAPAAEDTSAGEIVVTAQRRAERLQDTPIAITALATDTLVERQIEDTRDLSRSVPNLVLLPLTGSRSSVQLSLRGGSEQAAGLVTSEPAVAFYVDDVYRGRLGGGNLQLIDIARIEVLRGPQGTLYGRNAFSGAVKIVTRSPLTDQWADGLAQYGRFDDFRVAASAGGQVGDGVGASISALYRERGGYIDNIALNRKVGEEKNFAIRGKVEAEASETVTISAQASYTRDRNDGTANLVPITTSVPLPTTAANFITTDRVVFLAGRDYATLSPVPPDGRTNQFAASVDVKAEVGEATFRSITAYIDTKDGFRFDLSGGRRLPAPATGFFSSSLDRTSRARTHQFSQEFQLLGKAADDRLDWIVGAYYFQENSDQLLNDILTITPAFVLTLLPTTIDTKTKSYAAFVQGTYALTDSLKVTAGIRYSEDRKKLNGAIQNRLPFGPGPAIALTPVSLSPNFGSWTPKLGVDYKPNDDLLLYASVSRGFKAGGFNGLAVGNPGVFSTVYDPQTVWAYEAGAKYTTPDRLMTANLSVFRNDFSKLQQTSQIAAGSFAVQNVGSARLDGIELELTARPAEGLSFFGNLSLNDDKYKNVNPLADAARFGATRLPLTSKVGYQLGTAYESPPVIGDDIKLRLSANYAYRGHYFSVVNNLLRTEGYGLLDASIGIAQVDDRWSVTLGGRNLTDKLYFTTAATSDAIAIGEPRVWNVTFRTSF
jgi:iron complex outermembrane receptor protein